MKHTFRLILLPAVAFIFSLCSLPALAEDWTQWRGPDGQGHAGSLPLPLRWSETENVAWKTPLPGRGHSSPVIAGDEIWLTTAVETLAGEDEKKEKLQTNTGSQPLIVVSHLSLRAICVDRKEGKILHNIELLSEDDPDWTHAINTFASPTPVLEDGLLYCHFGTHGSACLDTRTQKIVWTNRQLKLNHENGPGSTPVSWGDKLIIHCDGSDVQYIAALNKKTGKIAWRTQRSGKMNSNPQLKKAYGTPLVVKINGIDQIISPAADWLYSYDPKTGEELWKVAYGELGFSIVPRPVVGHGMIYFSTSFMRAQVIAVRYDGEKPHVAWRFPKSAPKIPSPLLVGDELYIVNDSGIATCLDAKTGDVHWSERLGGNVAASPTHAGGRIYFHNREGQTFVVKAGPKFHLLATNQLDGGHWASAAAVDRAFYLRTDKALYRIEETKTGE